MKDVIHTLIWVLTIALLNGFVPQILSAQETESKTSYEGKSLSVWLSGFTDDQVMSSDAERDRACEAVRNIGTNAIPTLLSMFRTQNKNLCVQAAFGFMALREDAIAAIPALIQIHDQTSFAPARGEIVRTLGIFGPAASNAIPLLVHATADPVSSVRNNAVFALGRIHAQPGEVVPALIKCLHDSNSGVRLNAASALESFGRASKSAVPDLIPLLEDQSHIGPQQTVAQVATNAIKAIDPATAAKLGLK